ncbi:MAG TPA: response regulator [Candidatus Limnocylindrales bacterium]|nr:response regulator [Candidatus Limnocylindrales bacterium]
MGTSKKVKAKSSKILVVDDEPGILEFLTDLLTTFGYTLTTAAGGEQAIKFLETETFDVILVDLKMPRIDGLEVLRKAKALDPDAVVVFLTGYMTLENALDMMRAGGAFDCLTKPLEDIGHLQRVLEKAISFRRSRVEYKHRLEELTILHTREKAARLLEKKRVRELTTLIEVSRLITSSLNLKEVLNEILRLCSRLMSVNHAAILLANPHQELEYVESMGFVEEKNGFKIKIGEGLSGWVAAHGKTLEVWEVTADPRYNFPEVAKKHQLKSYLGAPLKLKEKTMGVLDIYTVGIPRKFSEDEIRLFSSFADQAAIVIDHVRLYEKLRGYKVGSSGNEQMV